MTTSVSRRFNIHDDSVLYNNAVRKVICEGLNFAHMWTALTKNMTASFH